MMKTKSVHESTLREMQRQSNGNLSRFNKSKETREVRKKTQPAPPQLTSIASISSKRLHKPSRSTIEPNQHLHYNSPIVAYPQNENIQTNTFSFTHILQQNLKNQHSLMSLESPNQPPVTSFQLNQEPKTISIAITNRSQQKSQNNDDNLMKNGLVSKEKMSFQRQNNHPKGSSVERSVSKSPLRAINMNKINNTPKIKQYRKEKEEQKSFKNALQNRENKQNQEIRFQCSQKIFKFMQNVKIEGLSMNKKDFANGEKSKSNLLSTGIINLSQRMDHDKLPSELYKNSKGNLFNRSIAGSSSNQIKEFFDEDSSPNSEIFLEDEVRQLKQKIMKSNLQLQKLISSRKLMNNLQDLLTNSYNPEISLEKSHETIKKLTNLKDLIIEVVEDIVDSTARLSRSFVRQIDECIKNVEASCKTNIDWTKIQEQLRNHDKFQSMKCQNEILMQRIRIVQEEIHQSNALSEKISNFSNKRKQIEDQLKEISLKITKTSHFETNQSQKSTMDRSYYSIFFENLSDKFQRLHSIITQSDVFST